MQKPFLPVATILVCIAAASAVYYFAEGRRKTDLENARRCDTDGRRFYSDYRRLKKLTDEEMLSDPEMHFSGKLNTCLVEVEWLKSDIAYRVIVDVYSNKNVVAVVGAADDPAMLKYSSEKKRLFSE